MAKTRPKKILSVFLSVCMIVSCMVGMSLTAYAATDTYTGLMNNKTVVKFNNHDWYIIADESTATGGTVTLLAADNSFGTSEFDDISSWSNAYSSSTVKGVLDALTAEGGAFAGVKDAIVDTNLNDITPNVTGAKLYLLSVDEASPLPVNVLKFNSEWWLRSPDPDDDSTAMCVVGSSGAADGYRDVIESLGVRPALKLNLSKVVFDSSNNTFSLKPSYIALNNNTKPFITVKRGETTVTSGAPQVGDVLTATTEATDLEYEWYRGGVKIDGATESTYTLTADDVGKAITVKVYQTKDADGNDLTGADRPTQTSAATAAVTKKVTPAPTADEAKTNSGISYTGETVTPTEGYEVSSTNVGDGTAITSITDILDGEGTPTIYVRKKASSDEYIPSEWVAVTLTARPAAPTGIGTTNADNASAANGTITGVTTAMEYSADNGVTWTTVTGTTITGLAPGTYLVRTKATSTAPAGKTTEVTIESNYTALDDTTKPVITIKRDGTAVTGTPQNGDVLTAESTASDLVYEWYRDGVKIDGATDSTYTLTADDVGKAITVKVYQTKDADGNDLTGDARPVQTSEATAAVEKSAADVVIEAIEALPAADDVTAADEAAIKAARTAYNALTEAQKNRVPADTLKKLTDAEAALDTVNNNAANAVIEAINALPPAADITIDNEADIVSARKAYDALTDTQKALVSADTLKKLTDAEEALANAIIGIIDTLPAAADVKTSDKAAIEAARKAYDALTNSQKALIPEDTLKKLTDAEAALAFETSKDTLNTLIASATEYYNSIKDRYPTIAAALKTAIDAAQAVADNANATAAEINAAIAELEAAIDKANSSIHGVNRPIIVPEYTPATTTTTDTTTTTEPEKQTEDIGTFEDITDEEENAGDAGITTPKADLADAVLDANDRAAMAKGSDIKVYLEVEEVKPTAAEKALIDAAVAQIDDDIVVAMFLDIDLFKQVGNGKAVQMHETNGKIEVSIDLPDELKNNDPNVERTYYVVRIHNGEVEFIPCTYDPETGKLSFLTDKFSMYVIAYVDEEVTEGIDADDDDEIEVEPGIIEPDDKQPVQDADVQAGDVQAAGETNPHTGSPLAGMGTFAALSFFAAAAAYTIKKRRK